MAEYWDKQQQWLDVEQARIDKKIKDRNAFVEHCPEQYDFELNMKLLKDRAVNEILRICQENNIRRITRSARLLRVP